MKKWIFLLLFLVTVFVSVLPGQTEGYIVAGWTRSFTHGTVGADADLLLYKLNAAGNKQWRKNYGGVNTDFCFSVSDVYPASFIIRTSDGGFLLQGKTLSYSNGDYDFLVYKLDAAGNKQWRKNFGGKRMDLPMEVIQTADGGYLLAGWTRSYVHGTPGSDWDFLVYKLDAAGNKQWRKNFGGTQVDQLFRVQTGADGGYMLAGRTRSFTNGEWDLLLYKLNAAGVKQWRRNYGGTRIEPYAGEYATHVCLEPAGDGGWLLAATTGSYVHGPSHDYDFLAYKLDGAGNKQWRRNYGGVQRDWLTVALATAPTGFALAGSTQSYITGSAGDYDFLVYKLDTAGNKQWRKNYGGSEYEADSMYLSDIQLVQTSDGGFALAGPSQSYNSGASDFDFLLFRLNAAGAKQWRRNFGGVDDDPERFPYSNMQLAQTEDGGFLMAGTTSSFVHGTPGVDKDMVVYKITATGGEQWMRALGGIFDDVFVQFLELTE